MTRQGCASPPPPEASSFVSSSTRHSSSRKLPSHAEYYAQSVPHAQMHFPEYTQARDARPILPKAAFFMGDLRDGLPMLNLQAAFLISAQNFTEKQVGLLFFVFGISQFACLAPAGYYLDYSRDKIRWVNFSGIACSSLTILTVVTAAPYGANMGLMIFWKVLQGGITAILPPGFNGVTLGIVGSAGFTEQVSRNRMMNHIGTALVVTVGSIIAYILYPNIGHLFVASPLFAIGFVCYMRMIKPGHVNAEAASALVVTSPTMTEYEAMDDELTWDSDMDRIETEMEGRFDDNTHDHTPRQKNMVDLYPDFQYVPPKVKDTEGAMQERTGDGGEDSSTKSQLVDKEITLQQNDSKHIETALSATTPGGNSEVSGAGRWSVPSFNFGWGQQNPEEDSQSDVRSRRPQTPMAVLMDPTLLLFTAIVFFFHAANSSVLPLVMQSVKVTDPHESILLSGACILIAQGPMAYFAKLCGDYSPRWGRKSITLVGLISLTVRCSLLTLLTWVQRQVQTLSALYTIKALIVSTQLLDSVGAGIFGTMYIVITSDISGGTGRFSLLMGLTTSAMCLGGTVSGFIGQTLALDYGYSHAFLALGVMSLVPFFMFFCFMPETLPDYAKPKPKRRKRLEALFKRLNKHRRTLSDRFRRNRFPENDQKDYNTEDPHDGADRVAASRNSDTPSIPGTACVELV